MYISNFMIKNFGIRVVLYSQARGMYTHTIAIDEQPIYLALRWLAVLFSGRIAYDWSL